MTDARVGVDVGGTFTDVVTVDDGELSVTKAPSTPDAPEAGVLDGLERATAAGGPPPSALDALVHGTTVATNAVLEETWAETALVTTEGFRDVLEIGRQDRPDLYDLAATKPDPVVPRDRRFEVPERLDERGNVREPLDEDAVRAVASDLAASGVDSVAVSLLFAFENDAHERRVAELLQEVLAEEATADATAGGSAEEEGNVEEDGNADRGASGVAITTSSEVLPEVREYERTLATAINAALLPVMDAYVGALDEGLTARDCAAPLEIMTSAGGLVDAGHARRRPVETLLSGPAAGVQGAAYVADAAGEADLLTMDMGGTSCDVSVVTGGEPTISTERTVGDFAVAVPAVDVHTIGAGGGSIAWLDDGGALRVGPRSAGAEPGPVCYGRGGDRPTVTDAHLLLGRIDADRLLTDELDADVGAVEAAMAEHVADPLGQSVEAAARGVLRVANASMERALRVVSVERGHDPRQFSLVAYGGAGPLHATALADALDVPRVLVPRAAGALSALGLLATDRLHALSTSMVRPLADVDPVAVADVLADLEAEGRERLGGGGGGGDSADSLVVERSLDLRYVGQSSELSVPLASGSTTESRPDREPLDCETIDRETVDRGTLDRAAERFHDLHRQRYGHAAPDEPVELVTARVRVRDPVDSPALSPPRTDGEADDAIREERSVAFGDEWVQTRIYDRERLPAGAAFDGPAIVEGPESTVVVRPGQAVTVDDAGTIVVEVDP